MANEKKLKKGEEKKEIKATTAVNTDAIVAFIKNLYEDLINMFKKPASTLKEKMKNANIKMPIVVLILISIAAGLFTLAFMHYSLAGVLVYIVRGFKGISTFKVFLCGALITFVFSFIPILISLCTARILKNTTFDLEKALTLYAYSFSPLIIVLLVLSLFLLANISILTTIVILCSLVVCIACLINYFKGYLDEVKISADKMAYIVAIMLVASAIIINILSSYIS